MKGIKIDKNEIKISLPADDITLILSDINYVQNSFKILKSFSKCAALKINVDKTQAKYIGSLIMDNCIELYCIVLFFIVAGTYNHHIHVQFLIIIPSPYQLIYHYLSQSLYNIMQVQPN